MPFMLSRCRKIPCMRAPHGIPAPQDAQCRSRAAITSDARNRTATRQSSRRRRWRPPPAGPRRRCPQGAMAGPPQARSECCRSSAATTERGSRCSCPGDGRTRRHGCHRTRNPSPPGDVQHRYIVSCRHRPPMAKETPDAVTDGLTTQSFSHHQRETRERTPGPMWSSRQPFV